MKKISILILLCLFGLYGIAQTNNLITRWHFDGFDINGKLPNSAPPTNPPTNYNGTYTGPYSNPLVTGKFGNAIQFNQAITDNDFVSFANDPLASITRDITICVWIKLEKINIQNGIIDYYTDLIESDYTRNYSLYFVRDKTYSNIFLANFAAKISTAPGAISNVSQALEIGKWNHIVCVQNSDVTRIYINGIKALEANSLFGYDLYNTSGAFQINHTYPNNPQDKMTIDEMEIYNYPLSENVIKEKYEAARIIFNYEGGSVNTTNDVALTDEYANNGTLNNMSVPACWVQGYKGNALQFDGINDYVSCADNANNPTLNIDNNLTIEAWIQPNFNGSFKNNRIIASKVNGNTGYALEIKPNRHLALRINGTEYPSTSTTALLTDNNWHHVAATFEEGKINLYINGENVGVHSPTFAPIIINSIPLTIAGLTTSNYFKGIIDDLNYVQML